jgi:DNA-binding response OmpR family regulator
MTLLYIDDDQDDLDLFREAVNSIHPSHQCLVALTGEEGIRLLEAVKPDLIFLDINMPGLGGWDLVKMIRAKREFDNVPVYMLSTTRNRAELEMFTHMGASGCLVKPNSFRELCEIFKSLLMEKEKE